ncbi:hypothetical protein NLG97_g6284 [Lecanicillium saksenae]|uniref:Uncharacterized protein n=1 Tax=Lecanicillium saksenae TaxID=468837 RepID=A0ACC1QT87_9HYPO|nr:hypothetical protein NLG97_g6284 [Lecanicillium saksenae]
MVTNCNTFYYIYKGNTCGQINSYHSITQEQFARWNPDVGVQCTGLWADAYACVGVIELMTAFLDAARSRPIVAHVGDRLADENDTSSALEAVSAIASGKTGSGKSEYSIIIALIVGGVLHIDPGVHARGTEDITGDTAAMSAHRFPGKISD